MSDKELIIRSLENVNRRIRTNRLLGELTSGFCAFLIIPVVFKVWDLFRPFSGLTVTIVLTLWLIGLIGYLAWRMSGRSSLYHAAAALDHRASLRDEIKTAYWFVTAPAIQHSPDWVALQVRRAAQRAMSLNVNQLYPRVIPRTSYAAAGLFILLISLNFAPLSTNHNWFYLQAAPAFTLTPQEQSLISETRKLLKQVQKTQPELAKQLEQIVQSLEQGTIDPAEAMKQIEQLKNSLDEGNLDLANINEGLDEMAQDLSGANETQQVSRDMSEHDFQKASEDLKELADGKLNSDDGSAMQALEKALEQASENSHQGMQSLAQDMKQAADGLANNDMKSFKDAMNQASKDIEDLQQKVEQQQAKNSASQDLQSLKESLQQRQQQAQGSGQQRGEKGQTQQGQSAEKGKQGQPNAEAGENDQAGSSQGGTPDENAPSGDQKGQQPGKPGDEAEQGGAGRGLNTSGMPNAPMNIMGAPTKLDVKLEQEKVNAENDGGTPQNLEEESKQERSKLDYRNVHSDLSPAQKDVLNRDKIPWEYKGLIKNYFQAIRSPRGK